MFRKQAKVTKAPSSVTQSSSLSTQTTTSVSSRATASVQSVTSARQTIDDFYSKMISQQRKDELQFEKSYGKIMREFNDTILPKSNLLDELFKMPNIRLSRNNSSIH